MHCSALHLSVRGIVLQFGGSHIERIPFLTLRIHQGEQIPHRRRTAHQYGRNRMSMIRAHQNHQGAGDTLVMVASYHHICLNFDFLIWD